MCATLWRCRFPPCPALKSAQYYASKAYFRQTDKGSQTETSKYANLKQVIFIAITDYILFPDKEATHECDLRDLHFVFIELAKFKKTKVDDLKDMLEKWYFYFQHAEDISPEELEKLIQDKIIKEAFEALDQFHWTEIELNTYEAELKRVWDNAAVEAGKKAQFEKEMLQAQGREEEKIVMATKMLDKGMASENISEFTGLSETEIEALKLNSQTQ
jgi:predicted transposase/invertase (TIGR01784 family)